MSGVKTIRLSEFCVTGSGGTPSRSKLDRYYEGGTIPWIKSGELRESIINSAAEYVTDAALKESSIKLVPAGAILLAMYGATIGRLGILGIQATTNQAVCHIVPDPTIAVTRYIYHALSSQVPSLISMGAGGAQPNINQGLIKNLAIPLPSIPQQRRIAAILDQADALRTKRREALAQLDSLTQSIFIDMFGDPIRNPNDWPMHSLKSLGNVLTGRTPPGSMEGMFGGSIPFVTPGDLGSNQAANRTLTPEGAFQVMTVRAGSTLVCCIGTVGKMDKISQPSAFNQQINAIEWFDCIDDDFGFQALSFFKSQFASQAALTTVPILKKSTFQMFELPVPPLKLQKIFSEKLFAVNALKSVQRIALIELDALFASLQHRAFQGEL